MREYDSKNNDNRIQRTKDRRAMIWRMEEEEEERERVQKKSSVEIGGPGDKYEQEADAVAQKVLSGTSEAHSFSDTGTKVESKQEAPGILMAKSKDGQLHGTEQLQAKLDSSKGGGASLDASTQNEIGGKMGADLSGVKIHTDNNAAEMAEGINAKAFTHGQDVYFNKGNFDTASAEGKGLLAHELAHTQQQKNGLQRKIQRAMKFEFQTGNYVWNINEKTNTAKPLERKFGEYGATEDGSVPAFLATGKHGESVADVDDYIQPEDGPATMIEAKKGVDQAKEAQYIKEYQFTTQVTLEQIIGKPVGKGQLKLIKETDNAVTMTEDQYNLNTFQFKYFNFDNTPLEIHLDQYRNFQEQSVKLMKVGKQDPAGIDKDKKAEFKQKIVISGITTAKELIGKTAAELTAQNPDIKITEGEIQTNEAPFNAGTFKFNYENENGDKLDVHRDPKGKFQDGSVKFMKKATEKGKGEQTAVELQSEKDGFIEFETPKWFRKWSDLRDRIQDAVDMTTAISASKDIPAGSPVYESIKAAIPGLIKSGHRDKKHNLNEKGEIKGRIVEWPFPVSDRLNDKLEGGKLYAEIRNPSWSAHIQPSEEIQISQYGSLLKEHGSRGPADFDKGKAADLVTPIVGDGTDVGAAQKVLDKVNTKKIPAENLLGFLQLILSYIVGAQYYGSNDAPKFKFQLLARTNFLSIYKNLLSSDEKTLFRTIVNSSTNPLIKAAEKIVNVSLTELYTSYNTNPNKDPNRKPYTYKNRTLTRDSLFFPFGYSGYDAKATYKTKVNGVEKTVPYNPTIYEWLVSIYSGGGVMGKDKLSPLKGGSASMGRFDVETQPGNKDTGLVKFEIRASDAHGGADQPASRWVEYARQLFEEAATARSRPDIADDPSTGKNEATSTTLIYDP